MGQQKNLSYQEARKQWQSEKPKGKMWYRATYAKGYALGSDMEKKAMERYDRDVAAWKAREPKLEDFQKKDSSTSVDVSSSKTVQTTDQKSNNKVVDGGQLKDFVVAPQLKRSAMKGKLPRHMIHSSRRVLNDDDADKAPKIRFSGSAKRSAMRGKIR